MHTHTITTATNLAFAHARAHWRSGTSLACSSLIANRRERECYTGSTHTLASIVRDLWRTAMLSGYYQALWRAPWRNCGRVDRALRAPNEDDRFTWLDTSGPLRFSIVGRFARKCARINSPESRLSSLSNEQVHIHTIRIH